MALPVLEAVICSGKEQLRGDPVADTIRDVISPEAVATGQPTRAVDALIVA
jgi:hypothetical protein